MASDKARAQHIFKKWSASLANRDRSKNSLDENFGDLFYDLWAATIPFKVAEELVNEAVAAHMPTSYIANITYKKAKAAKCHGDQSFNEYMTSWKALIHDKATAAFYNQYPIDGVEEQEKKFGSLSAQEYSKQRRYAESFPHVDLDELERKREQFIKSISEKLDGEA